MEICLVCARGFHNECDSDPCCCKDITGESSIVGESSLNEDSSRNFSRSDVGISAGRKRAAKLYEVDPLTPCDWRGKANCGGGFVPVVGCLFGFQEARHHGPDKNTTSNEPDNVHLICSACHNFWHRRNDPKYRSDRCPEGIQLHEPRWATLEEIMTREVSNDRI